MHVILLAAVTVDGFIAHQREEVSTRWTSREDAAWFMQRTTQARVLVMGSHTFSTINRPLPQREIIVLGNPERWPQLAKVDSSESTNWHQLPPVAVTTMTATDLVSSLAAAGHAELAVCGGSQVYTQFLQAKLIDRLFLTREAVLFGQGVPFLSAPVNVRLEQVDQKQLGPTTWLTEYVPHYQD